ncbi:MAG: ABC transporter permease [Clostridiales bacterium]|nr:ABC transporter permease [Clostridiales bacterium]MDR2749029.1 ABC transporter permease [Clostridiales bacterium]
MNNAKQENRNPLRLAMERFFKNKMAMTGLILIVIFTVAALLAPVLTPHDRDSYNMTRRYAAPSGQNLMGADAMGRDVLTRLLYAGRISLMVGALSSAISAVIGIVLGAIAGFYGKWVDMAIMRIADVFSSLPFYMLAITIMALFEPSVRGTIIVMGFLWWTGAARLLRSQILSLKEMEFMEATTAQGISDFKKITQHLMPNAFGPMIVTITLNIANAILTESALSYLGLGVRVPIPSWGNMLSDAQNMFVLQNYWWMWVPPGLCILITVMSINFVGEGLRDAMDPKLDR